MRARACVRVRVRVSACARECVAACVRARTCARGPDLLDAVRGEAMRVGLWGAGRGPGGDLPQRPPTAGRAAARGTGAGRAAGRGRPGAVEDLGDAAGLGAALRVGEHVGQPVCEAERLLHLGVALADGVRHGGAPPPIPAAHVTAVCDNEVNELEVPPAGGEVERRAAVVIFGVDGDPACDHGLEFGRVSCCGQLAHAMLQVEIRFMRESCSCFNQN